MFHSVQEALLLCVLLISMAGCVSSNMAIRPGDLEQVKAGEKTIVLFRVVASVENQAAEPFSSNLADDNIRFGIGGIETGGRLQPVGITPLLWSESRRKRGLETQFFLSPESRRNGWTYLVLSPGTYYLTIIPVRTQQIDDYMEQFNTPPFWYFDVPDDARLVYAGTIRMEGSGVQGIFASGVRMARITGRPTSDGNDRDMAMQLLSTHYPHLGSPQISLLKPYSGGPLIFRTPLRETSE